MINSRSVNDLNPNVKELWLKAEKEIKASGIEVLVVSTLRDQEYQTKLYNQGRTTKGAVVTNAKLIGPHGFGLALDLVPMVGGKCAWDRADLYERIAVIMKKHGFTWGGDWKSISDKPHFEYTQGLTGADLRAGKMPKFKTDDDDFKKGLNWLMAKGVITDKSYWELTSVKGKYVDGEYVRKIIERIGRL